MQHGMMFKQVYCQYPLCSPSRTSLHSGKRPDSTGVYDNIVSVRNMLGATYKFLPEYFDFYGYRTERFGKVGPCEHEDELYWDYVYKNPIPDVNIEQDIPEWWIDTLAKNESQTRSGKNTSAVIKKIEQPVATPYFYGLGLNVHNPFTPILASWNKTGDSSVNELLPVDSAGTLTNVTGNGSGNIILPDTPPNDTADIPTVALKQKLYFYTPDTTQHLRHGYYGEIIELDVHLGEVLDVLDSLNLWDSTVVIFWSDHGLHMGEHLCLWLKLTLFEESLRVPLVICAPGKKTGICNTPVELVDLFPTLAELCGLPAPPDQEGSSMVPLLENPEAEWKKAVFSQVYRKFDSIMGRAVRTNQYHYNSWEDQGEELYNIKFDPHEYTNLAGKPQFASILNYMRTLLINGWQGALPPVYTRSAFFKDNDGDGYGIKNDSIVAYFAPDGYTNKKGDCNDNNANIHPGAKESRCNGIDDNCDGNIDENKPQPTITALGSLDICQTDSVVLRTEKGPDFSYQWRRNGNNISDATGRTYIATTTGNYKVKITYSDCSSLSESTTVISSCNAQALRDEITSSERLSLSPNPSNGIIILTYNSSSAADIDIKVYDRIGKILFNKADKAIAGINIYQLNLSFLMPGLYDIELSNNTQSMRVKLVVEK
ncbi:MAG: sulfatase-like hydrolase/transferase, partial [Parafilimonas sp.]